MEIPPCGWASKGVESVTSVKSVPVAAGGAKVSPCLLRRRKTAISPRVTRFSGQ
jgi:hypothetical protein